ncbi:MAG: DUF3232 domain-containing protein [Candidatus Woesearchaeota archaeon]
MDLEDTIETRYRRMSEVDRVSYDSECNKAYQRFQQIKEVLLENEDSQGISLLDELVSLASRYVESVVRMDLPKSVKYRLETWEFQEKIQELDQSRRIKHDAFISQLRIMNRYLFKSYEAGEEVPYGGVYSLAPQTLSPLDRVAVGDWAGYLVLGLYAQRGPTK